MVRGGEEGQLCPTEALWEYNARKETWTYGGHFMVSCFSWLAVTTGKISPQRSKMKQKKWKDFRGFH